MCASFFDAQITLPIVFRYLQKIPHPFLGPKGVRALLVPRGIAGYRVFCGLASSPHGHRRFFGLSGLYFSLQYLSLSDATVLTFLTPILTGFSGAIFLKEPLSLKELLAGGKHSYVILAAIVIHES